MASGTRDPLESAHLAFFAHFRDRMHWLSTETQVLATNVSRPPLSSANGGYARSLLEREVTCNVDELRKRVRTLREHVAVAPAAQMLTEAQALYERNEASLVATERALEAYGYVRPPKPPTPVRRPVAPSPPPPPREPELPPSPTMEAAHAGAEADLYDHDLYEPHPADASPPYARAAGGGYGRDGQSGAADENLPPSPGLSLESLGLSDAALRVVACGTSVALAARASPGPKPPSAQPAGAFDLLASLEPPPSAADRRAAVSPADLLSFGSSPAARREYTPQSPPYGVAEPTGARGAQARRVRVVACVSRVLRCVRVRRATCCGQQRPAPNRRSTPALGARARCRVAHARTHTRALAPAARARRRRCARRSVADVGARGT
jgi:hypothetical protein